MSNRYIITSDQITTIAKELRHIDWNCVHTPDISESFAVIRTTLANLEDA